MEEMKITLTRQEALVLYDWLVNNNSQSALPKAHVAELDVLTTIEGQLERSLAEVVDHDYDELVTLARDEVAAAGRV